MSPVHHGSSISKSSSGGSRQLTKVTILGAAGGIGQPLALLLMLNSDRIQHLCLYDVAPMKGIATDLSHIDRKCLVSYHEGPEKLSDAVRDAKVIIIPAGIAQMPGMSRDDLFGTNARILYGLVRVCAQVAPEAMLAIISNPVNSLVPLACEVYQRILHGPRGGLTSNVKSQDTTTSSGSLKVSQTAGSMDGVSRHPFHDSFRRIFGVTTLDVVRASSLTSRSAFFKSQSNGLFHDPAKIQVPVVGGHAGKTIIPLLSLASPKIDRKRLQEDKATVHTLVSGIQEAGIDVLNAKKGKGTATLAMAHAACRFTISLLRALAGEQNVVECAYVRHKEPVVADLEYYSTPLLLGTDGYVKSLGFDKNSLLPFEQQMIDEACKPLNLSIAKGEDYAREWLSAETKPSTKATN